MQRKTIKLTILTAMAGTLLAVSSASAAALSYARGDLLIGFTAPDIDTSSYLINLGQVSTFRNATQPITLSLGNTSLDLVTTFGTEWFNDERLQWGVFGANWNQVVGSDPANTLYAGRSIATPYDRRGASTQSLAASRINDFGRAYSENGTNDSTANSTVGFLQPNSAPNSFASFVDGGVTFGVFNDALANFGGGVGSASLGLYRMEVGSGPGDLVGTFSIAESGVITFTPVPEPGTVALLVLAAAALLLVARRRAVRA